MAEEPPGRRADALGELGELLRRCHRQELDGLASALGIKGDSLGLRDLALSIETTLRRRGANDIANITFRGGDGPAYGEVVRALAQRMELPSEGSVEQIEVSIVSKWVERSWDRLDARQRARMWKELEIEPPVPQSGQAALQVARDSLGDAYGYLVGYSLLGGVARIAMFTPLAPLAGCATLFWLTRPRDDVLVPAVIEVAKLRQALQHRVTVGFVGSPSSGKDAAIRAVFDVDYGNVSPIAGSTTEVAITKLPGATALYVVNTPGMGDVVESVTEEAKQVMGLIDVYVYVLNSQGGVQTREKSDYDACRATGRPVLAVVNKIDTLRADDRQRYLDDARGKLGAAERDFTAAAFDPLPQLHDSPIGVEHVRDWLRRALIDQGKSADELAMLSTDSGPETRNGGD